MREQKIIVGPNDQDEFDRCNGHYALFVMLDFKGFVVGKVESLMPLNVRERRYWLVDEGLDVEWQSYGLVHLAGTWRYIMTFSSFEAADDAMLVLADTIHERNKRVKEADAKFLMVAKLWQ